MLTYFQEYISLASGMISISLEVLKILKHLRSHRSWGSKCLLMIQPYKTVKIPSSQKWPVTFTVTIIPSSKRWETEVSGLSPYIIHQSYQDCLLCHHHCGTQKLVQKIMFKIPVKEINTISITIFKNPCFLAGQPMRDKSSLGSLSKWVLNINKEGDSSAFLGFYSCVELSNF